ncbi:hypothetical protein PU560_00660, partial [Georgenia sp. 10Sc9-8]|nr:hypothetical protein [Georgenia halotolerans]
SLQFVEEDEWSVPVRRPVADTDEGRMRFATHCFARMGTRKLFQPGHDRFYAVVVEVFCDEPGLPRPAPDDDFTLGLVVRRRTFSLGLTDREIRRLARDVLRGVVDPTAPAPGLPPEADVESGTQGWL